MEGSVKYEPKFGRVLIKREVKEKIGSIIVADAKRHANCEGVIVALGETAGWAEAYNEEGELVPKQIMKVGQRVIFGKHSGAWLDGTYAKDHDDASLFICQDADILCTIKENI